MLESFWHILSSEAEQRFLAIGCASMHQDLTNASLHGKQTLLFDSYQHILSMGGRM